MKSSILIQKRLTSDTLLRIIKIVRLNVSQRSDSPGSEGRRAAGKRGATGPLTYIMELIIPPAADSARPLHPNYIQILISTKKSLFESA